MSWQVILSRQAVKAAKRIAQTGLKPQAEKLLQLLTENPHATPPSYEKLMGNLRGLYSTPIGLSC